MRGLPRLPSSITRGESLNCCNQAITPTTSTAETFGPEGRVVGEMAIFRQLPPSVVGYFEASRRMALAIPIDPATKSAIRLALAPHSPLPRGANNATAMREILKARKNRLKTVCTALLMPLFPSDACHAHSSSHRSSWCNGDFSPTTVRLTEPRSKRRLQCCPSGL